MIRSSGLYLPLSLLKSFDCTLIVFEDTIASWEILNFWLHPCYNVFIFKDMFVLAQVDPTDRQDLIQQLNFTLDSKMSFLKEIFFTHFMMNTFKVHWVKYIAIQF